MMMRIAMVALLAVSASAAAMTGSVVNFKAMANSMNVVSDALHDGLAFTESFRYPFVTNFVLASALASAAAFFTTVIRSCSAVWC